MIMAYGRRPLKISQQYDDKGLRLEAFEKLNNMMIKAYGRRPLKTSQQYVNGLRPEFIVILTTI